MAYSDELMKYDKDKEQYILTEKALIKKGINLRGRLASDKTPSPEYAINGFLETVSDMIYGYIYSCNSNNEAQRYVINNYEQARKILEKALTYQAIYVAQVGNLYTSLDDNERSKAIDVLAINALNTDIKDIGIPITFRGWLELYE